MRDRDVSPTPRLKNTAEREVVSVEMRRRGDEETRRRGDEEKHFSGIHVHASTSSVWGVMIFCTAFCEGGGIGGESAPAEYSCACLEEL